MAEEVWRSRIRKSVDDRRARVVSAILHGVERGEAPYLTNPPQAWFPSRAADEPLETTMSPRYLPRAHVRSMIDPDGAILLDLDRGTYFSLNTVGAEIWQRLEKGNTHSEILDHLGATFEAPRERLARDLESFFETLGARGLIHAGA